MTKEERLKLIKTRHHKFLEENDMAFGVLPLSTTAAKEEVGNLDGFVEEQRNQKSQSLGLTSDEE